MTQKFIIKQNFDEKLNHSHNSSTITSSEDIGTEPQPEINLLEESNKQLSRKFEPVSDLNKLLNPRYMTNIGKKNEAAKSYNR